MALELFLIRKRNLLKSNAMNYIFIMQLSHNADGAVSTNSWISHC
jgi:hypothetical protein